MAELLESLTDKPEQGEPVGNNFYKIGLAVTSKGKGKSGSARVINYVKVTATTVYLTSIYNKSEKSTITDKELEQVFKWVP